MRLTFICPTDFIDDANQLAMALAFSLADGMTYRNPPQLQDANGTLYAAASSLVSPTFVGNATSPLVRPAWDVKGLIDMDAAARVQALVRLWNGIGDVPIATPDVLTVLPGDNAVALVQAAGLWPPNKVDL
jgi:hypothetical protein